MAWSTSGSIRLRPLNSLSTTKTRFSSESTATIAGKSKRSFSSLPEQPSPSIETRTRKPAIPSRLKAIAEARVRNAFEIVLIFVIIIILFKFRNIGERRKDGQSVGVHHRNVVAEEIADVEVVLSVDI